MATETLTIKVDEKGALVASRNIAQVGKAAKGAGNMVMLFKRALGVLAIASVIKPFIELADTFTVIQNKLKIVTTGSENLGAVTDELFAIATRTRSSFEATADSYSKFALAAKEMGRSQAEVLRFTELVNKAVVVGGSTASEAAGGLRQLSQGIASGALRGDELISVLENLPFVADTIAKELGVTRGELRKMGAEGKITADIVLDAFKNQADFLEGEYAKTNITVSQSVQLLKNSVLKLAGDFDQANSTTSVVAETIKWLAVQVTNLKEPLQFVNNLLVGLFREAVPIVQGVVDKFGGWANIGETLKELFIQLGAIIGWLLKDAAAAVDAVATGFNVLGRIIGTAVFGGLNDADKAWEDSTTYWYNLFRDFVNAIIEKLNSGLTKFGFDPIDLLPEKESSGPKKEYFNWGKEMGEAVSGGIITATQDLLNASGSGIGGYLERALAQARALTAKSKAQVEQDEGQGRVSLTPAQRDALAVQRDAIKELQREGELLQMTNEERAVQVELEKLLAAVKKAGGEDATLAEGTEEKVRNLIAQNTALAEQARILEEIKGPQAAYERVVAALNALQESGKITTEEYTAALKEAEQELKGANEDRDILGFGDALKKPFTNALDAVEEFTKTGKFLIKDFVQDTLAQMARIIAQKAFMSAFGGLNLPGFKAEGGPVVGGQPYIVGEKGPELMVPGSSGTIVSNDRIQAAMGGAQAVPSVAASVVNVKVVNVMDPAEIVEAMNSAEGEEAIINVISRNSTTVRQAVS